MDDRLDLRDVGIGNRRVVREVETGLFGVNQRSALLHMTAQDLAQRLVHQMGGRVVANRACTLLCIDAGVNRVAYRKRTRLQAPMVAENASLNLLGIVDDKARA